MIKILKYMRRRDWVLTFIAIFFTILRVYFELKIPEYMKQVTELVMTEGATLNSILTTGQGMLLAALGNFLVDRKSVV